MRAVAAVSVVVPARDAAGTLPALLDALAAQTVGPVQVVVVDDRSTDGTGAVAAAHPVGAVVVQGEGRGSYAARNRGLQEVTAPVVAFTDADCTPVPGWLEAALPLVAPDVLVAGRVVQKQREGAGVWERYDRATYLRQDNLVEQGFAATANLVLATETLRRLGGFDATLRSSGDRELGQRAVAAGCRVVLAADAVVEHEPRSDARGLWTLHRRLGAGWRDLARRGAAPPWWREKALRQSLGEVIDLLAADGEPLRRRQVTHVHLLAMTARWRGRLLG